MSGERSDLATWFVVEAEALTTNWMSARGESQQRILEGRMVGHLIAARHACGIHVGELVELAYGAGAPGVELLGVEALSELSTDGGTAVARSLLR